MHCRSLAPSTRSNTLFPPPGFPTTITLTKESCEAVFSGIADPPGKYLTGKNHCVLKLQEFTTLRDTVIYVRKKGDFVNKIFFEFRSRIGLRRLAPPLQAALPRSVGSGFKRWIQQVNFFLEKYFFVGKLFYLFFAGWRKYGTNSGACRRGRRRRRIRLWSKRRVPTGTFLK